MNLKPEFVAVNGCFYEKTCSIPNLTSLYGQSNPSEKLYTPWIERISSEWAWSLSWLDDRNYKHICLPGALPIAVRAVWNSLSIGTLSVKAQDITGLFELASTYGLTFKVSRVFESQAAYEVLYEDSIGTGEHIIKLLRFSNDLFAPYIEDSVKRSLISDIEQEWNEFQKHLKDIAEHQLRLYESTLKNSVEKFQDDLDRTKKLSLKRVAIIGKTKSGKSTLINSIIGSKVLPEAEKHQTHTTTKVPTFIHYADRDDYEIKFDTLDIETTKTKMKLLSTESQLDDVDKIYFTELLQEGGEELDETQLQEILRVIGSDEETQEYTVQIAIERWNSLKEKTEKLQQEECKPKTEKELASKLREFCTDTDLAFIITAIHVHGRFPHIQGIEIVDMPGFEDTSDTINAQTSQMLQRSKLEHIFYLFSSNIEKDPEARKRISSYRQQMDIDTTILLRSSEANTQISDYSMLTFKFIEPWKAVMRKEINVPMDFGAVDAKLANGSIDDFDHEKLGITQIRRVLKMISDSALLELESRLSHLKDRATELFLRTESYDTAVFDKHMKDFDLGIQSHLNSFPESLQLSSEFTKEELENHIKQHLTQLCSSGIHGRTLRAVLSKASYDEVHRSSSGDRYYTIDMLMGLVTTTINGATQLLKNSNPEYEKRVELLLRELCDEVAMPFEQINIFMTRHFRNVARHFHLFVNLTLVRQTLISNLNSLLSRMAQVYQGSKTVGQAAKLILQAQFPSLEVVHSLALNLWKITLGDCVASLKSEVSLLGQEIRLAFVTFKAKETQQVQMGRIKDSTHLTASLRIPQLVIAEEATNIIAESKKPVLLHVGPLKQLEIDFARVGNLVGRTKFLHLESPASASYFDLYHNGERYNSFFPASLENILQAFFLYQQRDIIKTMPILRPQGEPIGEGAYGKVYKVAYGNQLFAIKLIASPRPEKDFEREKLALIKLTHPRIMPLLAYDASAYCLVMPWMAGGDIYSMIDSDEGKQMLRPNFALKFAHQVADGLFYLHSKATPWMHRDLKSRNILLTSFDKEANCVISDFGSAKLFEHGAKNTQKVGTNPYMAPDVETEEYALPADIYSFGAVLVELIARKVLVSKLSINEFLSESNAQSHPLYNIAVQCCQKDVNARPCARQVFEEIEKTVCGSIPNFTSINDFSYICMWVRYRVLHSKTHYPIRSPKGGTQLLASFRIAVMLQYLESDVERIWNAEQIRLIANGLRTQTYCRNLTLADKALLQKNLTPYTSYCIYFYCNSQGECYIGKTDRILRTRHSEHVKRNNSNFDRRMKTDAWQNVDPIPVCTYNPQDYSQMTRYEVLHVLVFNTATVHDKKGLNIMLGGEWGASNLLRSEEEDIVEMMNSCSLD